MLSIRRERENVIIIRQWEKKKNGPSADGWLVRQVSERLQTTAKKEIKNGGKPCCEIACPRLRRGVVDHRQFIFMFPNILDLPVDHSRLPASSFSLPTCPMQQPGRTPNTSEFWCWNHPTSITSCKRTRSVNSGTDQGWGCFGWRDGSHTGKKNFKLYYTGKLRCIVNVSEHVMGRLTQVKVFCCA